MSIVTIRRWIHAPLGTAPIRTSRVQPCAILVRVLSRGVNEKLIKYSVSLFHVARFRHSRLVLAGGRDILVLCAAPQRILPYCGRDHRDRGTQPHKTA